MKQSLVEWLNHPEQPVTRDKIKNMKAELKAAKNGGSLINQRGGQVSRGLNPRVGNIGASNTGMGQDFNGLRREVKELMKIFKETKKARNKQKKEMKRERRATKRAAKKEHRAAKKDAKQNKRDGHRRRGSIGSGSGMGRGNWGGPWPAGPGMEGHMHGSFPGSGAGPTFPPGFPFSGSRGSFGRGGYPPHVSANIGQHGAWPFRAPQSPIISQPVPAVPNVSGFVYEAPATSRDAFSNTSAVSTAEQVHSQALQMDGSARLKEEKAVELRIEATGPGINEKERLKKLDEA